MIFLSLFGGGKLLMPLAPLVHYLSRIAYQLGTGMANLDSQSATRNNIPCSTIQRTTSLQKIEESKFVP